MPDLTTRLHDLADGWDFQADGLSNIRGQSGTAKRRKSHAHHLRTAAAELRQLIDQHEDELSATADSITEPTTEGTA